MPNFAYKVKTTKPSRLETIYLYKLDPPSGRGTKYIAIKVKRIENKFFPEKDFLDVYYAPASKEGENLSDFKLIKKIESDNNKLSDSEIVEKYPGIGDAQTIKDQFDQYSEYYKTEPLTFQKVLNFQKNKLEKNALPDERQKLETEIKIMRDVVAGGLPRLENLDLIKFISYFFLDKVGGPSSEDKPDGEGYTVTEPPPEQEDSSVSKRFRKLEFESTKRLMSFVSKLIKENNKFMYYLNEAEEEKKRRRPLEMGDTPPIETEKPKETPRASNRFRKLEMDDGLEATVATAEKEIELDPRAHSPAARSLMAQNKQFKVLYAGDREGNPVTVDKCYFCILQFIPEIQLGHLSSGDSAMSYEYVLIVGGQVKEFAPSQGTGQGQQEFKPLFPLSNEASTKAWKYMARNHQDTTMDLLKLMKFWGGNFPTNKFQDSANYGNAPFIRTEWNPSNPLKPRKTKVTFTNALDAIKKLTLPAKDGGLGAGSYAVNTQQKKASEFFSSSNLVKYKGQYSFLKQQIDHISKQIRNFGGESDPDAARFVKAKEETQNQLEELIKKAANEDITEQDLKSKSKEEEVKPKYEWVDLGLRLVPNMFTKNIISSGSEKSRPKIEIDTNDKPTASKPPEEETVDLEDLLV